MVRSTEEILQHADALAQRFETYEPDAADELAPAAVALLREAVAQRSQAERAAVTAVTAARQAGMSWAKIGGFLGTTGEAARQRYAKSVG